MAVAFVVAAVQAVSVVQAEIAVAVGEFAGLTEIAEQTVVEFVVAVVAAGSVVEQMLLHHMNCLLVVIEVNIEDMHGSVHFPVTVY